MTRQANDQSKMKILTYIIVKQLLITLRLKMLLLPSSLTSRSWRLSKVFILSLVATPWCFNISLARIWSLTLEVKNKPILNKLVHGQHL